MPLPSFFQRKTRTTERRAGAAAGDDAAVQLARTRARRRLIGAVVLLAIGIVGFPLVFDTKPRPISMDLPIEVAKSGSPVPAASAPPPKLAAPAAPTAAEDRPPPRSEAAAPAVVQKAPPPAVAAKLPTPEAPKPVEPKPPAPAEPKKPVPAEPRTPAPAAARTEAGDAARAQALLGGASAPAEAPGRFVVQVGAYSDPAALREVRHRVEKLGLKTYTQVVETAAGKRTRVRIGPFASHAEAERVGARLKGAGLPAAVLAL
jgi:DedD protein